MSLKQFKNKEALFIALIILVLLATCRTLIIPLKGDELTYFKLAENILDGKYFLNEYPSTIAPIIPIITALFTVNFNPELGVLFNKLFNLILVAGGFNYVYLIFRQIGVDKKIIRPIIVLTAINSVSISFFPSLYPEAMIFFGFWGFIYYSIQNVSSKNILITLCFFTLLIFTRYVFAVLGLILLIRYYEFSKSNFSKRLWKLIKYSLIFLIPVVLWSKYIYNIEKQNVSEISYFDRFKGESPIVYNLKAGLGIEKHFEVSRVNGIPAFASLFIPVTGFRSYPMSIVLILSFIFGYITMLKSLEVKKIFFAIVLVMVGYMFAGTGFSRYWLPMLPGFIFGFYFLIKKFNVKTQWVVIASYCIAFLYLINEVRLNIKILTDYWG